MAEEEDEISLIDLLTVIIKWRRLIIGFTATALVAVTIVVFVGPLLGLASFASYTVQAVVVPIQIPPALKTELAINTASTAAIYATEMDVVSAAVARHKLADDSILVDTADWKYRTYIARSFIGKKYRVRTTADTITFEVITTKPEAAKNFIFDMIASSEAKLRSDIVSRSALISKSMESLYKDVPSATTLSDGTKQLIVSSRNYMVGNVPALTTVSRPEVLIDPQGRAKTIAIGAFAALFFAIFLAFILEYVSKVKEDPEAMAKIRKALEKTPRLVKEAKKS